MPVIDIDTHFEPGRSWLGDHPDLAAQLPEYSVAIATVRAQVGDLLAAVPTANARTIRAAVVRSGRPRDGRVPPRRPEPRLLRPRVGELSRHHGVATTRRLPKPAGGAAHAQRHGFRRRVPSTPEAYHRH